MIKQLFYKIESAYAGCTIERFLRSRGYSRALLVQLKQSHDGLTIGGVRVFTNRRLMHDEILCVRIRESEMRETILPMSLPLHILYEDEDVIVIDKQAGMAVHPSHGNRETSLANALAAIYQQRGEPLVFRAIGRLDKNTSGLILLAKHALSACVLSEKGQVCREYRAICEGKLPEDGVIDMPIGRAEGSSIQREVREDGDRAITHFKCLSYHNELSFAHIWMETGRTHQIRVHMAHIGHPLIGDFLYHPQSRLLPRHALHAAHLAFSHPILQIDMKFKSPLPADMAALLK